MARDFYIPGQTLASVKGPSNSIIPLRTELGLSPDPIRVSLNFQHEDIPVDAWGGRVPPEIQCMLSSISITINLIHFDNAVLKECERLSLAGGGGPGAGEGVLPNAGARMGNNLPRFGVSQTGVANNFIGLNFQCPVGPDAAFRFYFAYLAATPIVLPLGTEKSIVQTQWRVIPYTQDPWQGGLGSFGQVLFDHTLDS